MDARGKTPSLKKKYQHGRGGFWPNIVCGDITWFPFLSVMIHTENKINSPAELLQSLLKVFSMIKM